MTTVAVIVQHKALPGRREAVRKVWEQHMAEAVAANPGHVAYYYCLDKDDPDGICAFQQYASEAAARDFLTTPGYAAYLRDVAPLLAGPPKVTSLEPVWVKGR